MEGYIVEIELLSEAIFGNGQSSTSFVDVEIQKDAYGIPFFKGKTFKGKLREEISEIAAVVLDGSCDGVVSELFGTEYSDEKAVLRFSDCVISDNVKSNLIYGIESGIINSCDITDSLTEVRCFTKLDEEGIAEKGSLRQARVIKKGLKLYCSIDVLRNLTPKEEGIIAAGIRSLRNLGTMESRGKGFVRCSLLKNGYDITSQAIKALEKEAV